MDIVVVNLSSTPLDDTQKTILSKGLNFVPTPKSPPILDIIASTEKGLSNADQRTADTIKSCISNILLPRHNIKFNITPIERRTLRGLKKNNSILITKADKGNVVVILDRSKYMEKIRDMLKGPTYMELNGDPTKPMTLHYHTSDGTYTSPATRCFPAYRLFCIYELLGVLCSAPFVSCAH
uniref:Uncharacterized protein n=1 Tax=Trichuris muris TaxID=70415 RepID=A0A5S6QB52_TRIMR